ncbi:hypothetical protein [Clostridium estertheticum]|uniref:hypothetical protein n=1 Tax=Clostridium estertheticum TaxID=238834 RepID=UPI001C0B5C23|nr:hypothetical protein [Clostridium estertheticum]MBU3187653.1 hypothetical protein [Clostridium estertheticum]
MSSVRLGVGSIDEEYLCRQCNTVLPENKVNKKTWCCDSCGDKLLIKIEDTDHRIVRLIPSEMNRFDDVFNYYDNEFLELKGVIEHDNGKEYILGVAGYGSYKVKKNDFIDCRWK